MPDDLSAWAALRALTPARLALGRSGTSVPTAVQLDLQLAHARARDAVLVPLDPERVARDLRDLGLDALHLHSAAPDRATYLRRPDLGRQLNDPSRALLQRAATHAHADLALVVADGLSASAVHTHAAALLAACLPAFRARGWRLAPICVVQQGRVALGDEVGALLQARQVVVLIGERPGMSAPDSLGAYLTHAPAVGRTDAERNCISNIHAAGLGYAQAGETLVRLLDAARALGQSGVGLKDEVRTVLPGDAEGG